nr:retrotransposon protein, putative, Ty1-copia subclass [Tanacetum cinerariifolium]
MKLKINSGRLLKHCDLIVVDYALETAARILNMVPTKKVDKTPYELWHGKVPNLSYLKVWGCEAHVKRRTADKLKQRSVKCIFVGYPKETMGYYFYYPPENKVVVERSVRTPKAPNILCLNVEIVPDQIYFNVKVEEHSLGDKGEPASYKAALSDPEFEKWLVSMNAKIQSMYDNKVWKLIDLSLGAKVVKSKWIYKKKTDIDGV